REDRVRAAEEEARGGLVRIREFVPLRVAVLVQEELREQGLAKFKAALEQKLGFFGAPAPTVARVASSAEALASALREAVAAGERLTRKELARLGDGGLFSADTSHLLPPYRTGVARGELGPP